MTIRFIKHSITWKRDMPEAVQKCFEEVLRHEGTDKLVFSSTHMLEGYKQDYFENDHLGLNEETRTQAASWLDDIIGQYARRDAAGSCPDNYFILEMVPTTSIGSHYRVYFAAVRTTHIKDVPEVVQTYFRDVLKFKDTDHHKFHKSLLKWHKRDFDASGNWSVGDYRMAEGMAWFDRTADEINNGLWPYQDVMLSIELEETHDSADWQQALAKHA